MRCDIANVFTKHLFQSLPFALRDDFQGSRFVLIARLIVSIIIIIIIKLALQHAHIKLRIMTCASTITLCMLEGMLASSASTLKVYNVH